MSLNDQGFMKAKCTNTDKQVQNLMKEAKKVVYIAVHHDFQA